MSLRYSIFTYDNKRETSSSPTQDIADGLRQEYKDSSRECSLRMNTIMSFYYNFNGSADYPHPPHFLFNPLQYMYITTTHIGYSEQKQNKKQTNCLHVIMNFINTIKYENEQRTQREFQLYLRKKKKKRTKI